jgi:hypothetical protein
VPRRVIPCIDVIELDQLEGFQVRKQEGRIFTIVAGRSEYIYCRKCCAS